MLGESANVSTQKRLRRQSAMRLALDGPAGGRHRVIGHGQSVLRTYAGHRRDSVRYQSGPAYGEERASRHRGS